MTSFNGFYDVVTIMISFTLLFTTSFCFQISQPPSGGPSNDVASAPKPLSPYENLVNDVGKSCHYDLTRNALQWPAYAKNKTEILKRNDKVWNDCIAVRPILP
ncbi:transmembrane protein, putative [Medicago truncatula]|uniref:Transmembrane protein, putative n=1 Tax=Medicago truncatula TaxID=3880 RepID=A0A072TQ23_MEDTR|nr:transmembrane protein, putative [Medicago truncatula]